MSQLPVDERVLRAMFPPLHLDVDLSETDAAVADAIAAQVRAAGFEPTPDGLADMVHRLRG